MDANYIIDFSQRTIDYLENDRKSFLDVISSTHLNGKLGFALIATAMASFDTYAWILFQSFDQRKKNGELFAKLLGDARFFDKSKYKSEKVFYARIRCGVMHQLYPKYAVIIANTTSPILCNSNGTLCINAYALYCDVLDGIRKIHAFLMGCTESEKIDYSFKLLLRAKIDEEAAENDAIVISTLPAA
ncbi:MAG: hypothetical protein ACXW09_14025 [Methylococcaceae bacterium]